MYPLSSSPKLVPLGTSAERPVLFPLAPGYTHSIEAEAAWHVGASRDPHRSPDKRRMHAALARLLSAQKPVTQVPDWIALAWRGASGRFRPPFNLRKKQ
jgi:hypothetical protein